MNGYIKAIDHMNLFISNNKHTFTFKKKLHLLCIHYMQCNI